MSVEEKIAELEELASDAYENGDFESSKQYYMQLQQLAPDNWKALYYLNYYKWIKSTVGDIPDCIKDIRKTIPKVLDLIAKETSDKNDVYFYIEGMEFYNAFVELQGEYTNAITDLTHENPDDVRDIVIEFFIPLLELGYVFAEELLKRNSSLYCCQLAVSIYEELAEDPVLVDFEEGMDICKQASEKYNYYSEIYEKKCYDGYWSEHQEEKLALEAQLNEKTLELDAAKQNIDAFMAQNEAVISELEKKQSAKLPEEYELEKQRAVVQDVTEQIKKCGLFKGKEKKALKERLQSIEIPKLNDLEKLVVKIKTELKNTLSTLYGEKHQLQSNIENLENIIEELREELTCPREYDPYGFDAEDDDDDEYDD